MRKNIVSGMEARNKNQFGFGNCLEEMGVKGDGGGKGAGNNIIRMEAVDGKNGLEKRNDFENRTFG